MEKNVEDSIKDGLIIATTTTGIFYVLKAANLKPPKASLDAMDIMKLASGIVGGVLVKDYTVYKKWINEWYINKFIALHKAIKLHSTIGQKTNVPGPRPTPRAHEGLPLCHF